MPLAMVALAWLLIMTGINGNFAQVGNQFQTDVMGGGQGGGFLNFIVGIIGIAVFFRIIGMPNAGKVFMGLVLLVFILQNENVLTTLENLGSTAAASTTSTGTAGTASTAASAAPSVSSGTAGAAATSPGGAAALTGETSGTGSST